MGRCRIVTVTRVAVGGAGVRVGVVVLIRTCGLPLARRKGLPMSTDPVKCWHTADVSDAGERLAALIDARRLSRREVARRIGAARNTIDNAILRGKPPRDREQYRKLVDLLGEDPFTPQVSLDGGPAVPLNELDPDQVIDLLAHLLRDPGFAQALAGRLTAKHPAAFGIIDDDATYGGVSERNSDTQNEAPSQTVRRGDAAAEA